jgi:hypothetical protein
VGRIVGFDHLVDIDEQIEQQALGVAPLVPAIGARSDVRSRRRRG